MSDLNFITQAGKSAAPLPSQGPPVIAEELRPVPQAEIDEAVPPPAKGSEPGLGEHLDLYDTEAKPARMQKEAQEEQKTPGAEAAPSDADATAAAQEKNAAKPELLGDRTGLPQPTTDPIHLDLPFLKPLSEDYLGHSIDARV